MIYSFCPFSTQSLDIGVFSPLKTYFHKETRQYSRLTSSAACPIKTSLPTSLGDSFKENYNKENIRASFRASRAWPVNLQKLLSKVVNTEQPPTINQQPQEPIIPENQGSDEGSGSFNTSQSSVDIQKQIQSILYEANQDLISMVNKAGGSWQAEYYYSPIESPGWLFTVETIFYRAQGKENNSKRWSKYYICRLWIDWNGSSGGRESGCRF